MPMIPNDTDGAELRTDSTHRHGGYALGGNGRQPIMAPAESVLARLISHRFAILSFVIPAVLLTVAFAVVGVYPFGPNSILIIDNHHQYTPFIVELGRILRRGGSLLYSWNGGLGSNYLARFAYYLSSPLNLFSVFVGDGAATEYTLIMVLTRAGAAGLAFFAYLRAKFRAEGFMTVACAVMYALSGYVLAYYWNLMWFDCVAIFPLVALGIEKLADDEGELLYCLTLAYTVVSNYFIAIMVCIYAVLHFAVHMTGRGGHASARAVLRSIWRFALYSAIAGALSAVVTLPAYFGLLSSSAAGARLPDTARFYSDMLDIIGNHLALIKPFIMVGLPNIYCGVIVLALVPLYFLNRGVALREKIAHGLLICFFLISFNVNTLDFLWHGTHFPNSLFFRFAFLYVFLILTLSYRAALRLDRVTGGEVFAAFAAVAGLILFMDAEPAEKTTKWTVYGSLAFLFAEAVAVAALRRSGYRRAVDNGRLDAGNGGGEVSADGSAVARTRSDSPAIGHTGAGGRRAKIAVCVLAALICAEIAVNAGYGIGEAGIFPKDSYLSHTGEVKPTVERVKALERGSGGYGFERAEFTEHTTYNTPVIYDYKGISYYSSTSYVAVNDMFGKLGLIHSNAWYVYRSAPPPLNSMFAVRWLMSKDGPRVNGIYDEVFFPSESVFAGSTNADAGSGTEPGAFKEPAVHVYENPYFLPVGFMVDDAVLSWNLSQTNPFLSQEDFIRRASGSRSEIFYRLEPRADDFTGIRVTSGGGADGVYRFGREDTGDTRKAVYRVTAERDGPVYVYVKCADVETVRITNHTRIDGAEQPMDTHDVKYPYIIDARYAAAGGDIEIEIEFKESNTDSFTLFAYGFDEAAYAAAWERLSAQGLRVEGYSDTGLAGTVDVTAPGLMFTSIPYDEGWRVEVDGEPARVETVGDGALTALWLETQGRHRVTFSYMTPGLIPGALITLLAAAALAGLTLIKRRPNKGNETAATDLIL